MKPDALLRNRHPKWDRPMGRAESFCYVRVVGHARIGVVSLSFVQPMAFQTWTGRWIDQGPSVIAGDTDLWPVEVA